jgi:lipopolysaccharide assembly protein A
MRFLKTLLWVLIAVAIALFAARNWTPVTVNLWGTQVMDTKLPVVIIAAFLLGLLPTFLLHKTTRWRLTRKLDSAERALSDIAAPAPAPPPLPEPIAPVGTLAPSAAPIAVPPGVS